MGNTYLWAGEYQKSVQQFEHMIDLDPTFPLAHFFFASCLAEIGKYEQAIQEMQKGQLLEGQIRNKQPPWRQNFLKHFELAAQTVTGRRILS